MFLTPEEMMKKKKRNKYLLNFLAIPLVALAIGAVVALVGNMI